MITEAFSMWPHQRNLLRHSRWNQDNNCYLLRRANKFINSDDYYGYGNTLYNFLGTSDVVLASNMKVGIAFREINGERFALLVYDVTITPTTPAP